MVFAALAVLFGMLDLVAGALLLAFDGYQESSGVTPAETTGEGVATVALGGGALAMAVVGLGSPRHSWLAPVALALGVAGLVVGVLAYLSS